MEITFLGAVREVTGSMHVLSVNKDRIMLDCGMFQGGARNLLKKTASCRWILARSPTWCFPTPISITPAGFRC
jgi:Cft2 family RNA processing exonuclease